jgi:predicted PurR-regulated permease PerM
MARAIMIKTMLSLVAMVALVWISMVALTPVVMSGCLAYALLPAVDITQRYVKHRSMAIFISVFTLYAFLVIGSIMIAPMLLEQSASLFQYGAKWLHHPTLTALGGANTNWLTTHAAWLKPLGYWAITSSHTAIQWFLYVLISPFLVYYWLQEGRRIGQEILRWIPHAYRQKSMQLANACDAALSSLLRGQLTVMMLLWVFYAITLRLFHVDNWIALSLLMAFLSIIPLFGAFIGMLLAGVNVWLMTSSLTTVSGCLAVLLGIQYLESTYLTPKLIGNALNLSPLWIVTALMIGGQLGGLMGCFFALPIAVVLITVYRQLWGVS